MSVLGDVFGTLREMSQLQLLFAFVASTGYVVAQGGLVGRTGRRIAWVMTLVAGVGFTFFSADWMYAAMLLTFAIAGLGLFAASAWLISRMLGFSRARAAAEAAELLDTEFPATHAAPLTGPRTLSSRSGAPHSA